MQENDLNFGEALMQDGIARILNANIEEFLVALWLCVRKNESTRYSGNGTLASMPMALIKSMYDLFLNRHLQRLAIA